jgi:hypothetical protein
LRVRKVGKKFKKFKKKQSHIAFGQWKIQGRGVEKALENPVGGVKKTAEIQGMG